MQMVAAAPSAVAARRGRAVTLQLPWERMALLTTCAAVAFLPFLIPQGPGNLSPVDVLIVLGIATTLCWAIRTRLPVHAPYAVPVAVMAFAGTIASIFSAYPGLGALAVVQDLVLLVWSTTVVTVCSTPRGLSAVLRTWACASLVWALVMIAGTLAGIPVLSGQTAREGVRASITFGDPNMAAGYYCTSLLVVWASRTPRRAAARRAAYVVLLAAIALTGSNGFTIATAAAVFVAAFIGMARRRSLIAALLMGCVVVGGAGALVTRVDINTVVRDAAASAPVLRDYVGRFTQTTAVRADLLQETLALASGGGLVGIGPGAVKPTLEADQAGVAFEAHSDYTASIVERGLLGGAGFVMLLVTIALRGRIALGPLQPAYAAVVPRAGALIGVLVAYAITADIYELLHFRYVWTLLAILAAVGIWGRARPR
jgi:hypothetical protein